MVRIRIDRSAISLVKAADESLGMAVEANAALTDAEEVEIVTKVRQNSKQFLARGRSLRLVKKVLGVSGIDHALKVLQVRGRDKATHQTDLIDLLKDEFVSEARVAMRDETSRALDPGSAYEAINTVYLGWKEDLEMAARMTVDRDLSAERAADST